MAAPGLRLSKQPRKVDTMNTMSINEEVKRDKAYIEEEKDSHARDADQVFSKSFKLSLGKEEKK